MLLIIDAGNTNIVFAVYDGDSKRGQWRAVTKQPRTADEHAVWLTALMTMQGLKATDITDSAICSVVPQAVFDLEQLCRKYFHVDPITIGRKLDLGIEILMDEPHTAGADRLANAVGVHKLYGGPAIVIDFGTGTTFDVIDGRGSYRGGIIAPGINLSLEALHAVSAQLPRIVVVRPPRVIGGGTVAAMQSGIYWGYISMIEGLVRRIRDEMKVPMMRVIATGGLAPLFAEGTDVIDRADPDLTLVGIVEIWKRNRPVTVQK
ncbi:MAG: type III pantothenate kinase [Alphaproteobacteria bacterium]|nr:type III pantothenate kinase [Alphaproteobacteria bacterium]